MLSEPYTSPEQPAPNIISLIEYLSSRDDEHSLYRGQVKRYDGPLVPSAFRGILRDTPVILEHSTDTAHSLRKVGRRFIGNFIWDREDYYKNLVTALTGASEPIIADTRSLRDGDAYFKSHFTTKGTLAFPEPQTLSELERFLKSTTSTIEYNSLAEKHGYRQAVTLMLQKTFPRVDSGHQSLHRCVDNFHRDLFHRDILLNSMGYIIGSLISQHYGFSSGCLDATTSINIAAFFATHDSPEYTFLGEAKQGSLGVIYKIPNPAAHVSLSDICDIDYYNAPTLVTHDILRQLEFDVEVTESLSTMKRCFEIRTRLVEALMGMTFATLRQYDLLKLPKGCVAASRIGRQKAALVIPDEIHKGVRGAYRVHPLFFYLVPDAAGTPMLCQQSIEDLHYRDGLQCYYFYHTDINPCPDLSPANMWPNDQDFFLVAIAYLFMAGLSFHLLPGCVLPKRIDLVDPGYGAIDCSQLLAKVRPFIPSKISDAQLLATADCLESETDKQLYSVYKAGTLSYQGHVTGDGAAIRLALRYCRKCRERDSESIVLISLEMLLHEALGNMREVICLRDEAVGIIEKECKPDQITMMGYSSAFHLFMGMYYSKVYQWRFRADFTYLFYEMYQTS
jgi:hypothetical protein